VGKEHDFLVDVTPLRKLPGSVMAVHRAGRLSGLALSAVAVPEGDEVAVDAELAWASDDVVVTATVRAGWSGQCRRCLGDAVGEVTARVREVYEPASDGEETYALNGSRVDLAPLVRDAVILGLPPAPSVTRGVRGFAPSAGPTATRFGAAATSARRTLGGRPSTPFAKN